MHRDPCQAGPTNKPITQLVSLVKLDSHEVYLMVAGENELSLYNHNTQSTRAIDYGADGAAYADKNICNIQVASNNRFFMIGIPSKNALDLITLAVFMISFLIIPMFLSACALI